MPVRAPVIELEAKSSDGAERKTSDAKSASLELRFKGTRPRIGESGVGSDAGPICYARQTNCSGHPYIFKERRQPSNHPLVSSRNDTPKML